TTALPKNRVPPSIKIFMVLPHSSLKILSFVKRISVIKSYGRICYFTLILQIKRIHFEKLINTDS
ncbi:hypothetical protein P4403_19600, partial [Bacillus thuringiensis]